MCQCDSCVSGVICMFSEYEVCNVYGVGIWCVSVHVVSSVVWYTCDIGYDICGICISVHGVYLG